MSDVMTGRRPGERKMLPIPKSSWRTPEKKTYRYKVYLLEEEDGGHSVRAASLPGVASQGDTEQDALSNVVTAFEGAIASYKKHGEEIPWSKSPRPMERGEVERWVIVHG
jgi:predicted RNase H-like HicB family nuclease